MAGTKEGRKKTKDKLIAKYGSEEKYLEHMHSIATKGGEALRETPRGFAAMDKLLHKAAAAKGGRSRGKRLK
jgi:hypothetical protein